MGLIGEILKGSQALRYHAKNAEVAGKNLSHVNDPNYARQRVLVKDAHMYADSFSLSTGGLRSDGLDHMRSDLLDRRVISEVGGGASLEARKEILDLLQLVLGEKVNRQSLNAGLDDMHESDLAPGSLTRALNDFFNAYQELSAAPTEASVRQELIHKAKTLVARINEMGTSFEELEGDLSETVQHHTKVANDLLSRIHLLNRDIRRFEIQGKGRATDLRDLRQKGLEDLSKILDFTAVDDVDPTTGEGTGLINLSVTGKDGSSIVLLDVNGPKTLKPFISSPDEKMIVKFDKNGDGQLTGDELVELKNNYVQLDIIPDPDTTPTGEGAREAEIRAVMDTSGKLSGVEIIDGGSGYDDSAKPITFTFTPPSTPASTAIISASEATTVAEKIAAFTSSGLVEKIEDGFTKYVRTTDGLTESSTEVVVNGFSKAIAPEDLITLRPYKTGEIVVDGEDYYQALVDTFPWDYAETDETAQRGAKLTDTEKFLKLTSIPDVNTVPSFESAATRSNLTGYNKGQIVENGGKYYQAVAEVLPVVTETGIDGDNTEVTSQAYQTGDVFFYNNTYYQVIPDPADASKALEVAKGTTLAVLSANAGEISGDFLTLGSDLPIVDEEQILSRTHNQSFLKGDYLFDGENNRYYQAKADFSTGGDVSAFLPTTSTDLIEVNAFKLSDGTLASRTGQSFDVDKFQKLNISYVYPDGSTTTSAAAPIATAEAVVRNGTIIGFKITNEGSGYPLTDSVFVDDVALDVSSGSIHGYQQVRQEEMESFRLKLNTLVGDVVTKINQIYNPEDEPGNYVFGFPAMLSRITQNSNQWLEEKKTEVISSSTLSSVALEDLLEKQYSPGDGIIAFYRDEVDSNLLLPYAETDTFTIVNASAFFPGDRGTDRELLLDDPNFSKTYVGARRMKNVTIENDMKWVGEDGVHLTKDDGRSIMMAYEELPFRMSQGDKTFLFGDNFSFDVMIKEQRNLAKALNLDEGFTLDGLIATHTGEAGANEVALGIAELGNGDFTEQIAVLNTEVGTNLGDVADNLEHQKMVEGLLIDERQAVSSVSMDEEVANLMRYQRAFQASARVLTTLDSMLELVVMGLIR